jgi:dolichol-phosphate mannosyltransferase
MRRQQEKGLSTAVVRGWQVADGSVLGVIDADLQHPPEKLVSLYQAIKDGADLAVASRHVTGGGVSEWSFIRRILSRGAQMLGLMILPAVVGRVTDPMSGYFLVRREAIADVSLNPKGYKILLEVIGRGQIADVAEVGYVFQERFEGESKVSWRHYFEYLNHLLHLRSRGRLGKLMRRFSFIRALKFYAVGFSGIFVDMGVLYLLHTVLGLPLTRSKIGSAEVAILTNFLLHDIWTFSDLSKAQRGLRQKAKRFLKYNLICLSGLVLNILVLNIVYNLIFGQRWAYLANFIAIASVTIWNYWMSVKLGWRVTEVDK